MSKLEARIEEGSDFFATPLCLLVSDSEDQCGLFQVYVAPKVQDLPNNKISISVQKLTFLLSTELSRKTG